MVETTERREVSVFGSHTIKVPADTAVIRFSIWEKAYDPKAVTSTVLAKSDKIQRELLKHGDIKVATSRITLQKSMRKVKRQTAAIEDYYSSSIDFTVTVKDLDNILDIQQTVIDLGVSNVSRTTFETSKLKAYRAAARKLAIKAAKSKAELYCHEVDARVGKVLSITDKNPDYFEFSRAHQNHYNMMNQRDDADTDYVTVSGTVEAVFEIE